MNIAQAFAASGLINHKTRMPRLAALSISDLETRLAKAMLDLAVNDMQTPQTPFLGVSEKQAAWSKAIFEKRRAQILTFLRDNGPQSAWIIRKSLGIGENVAAAAINSLRDDGYILDVDKKWEAI